MPRKRYLGEGKALAFSRSVQRGDNFANLGLGFSNKAVDNFHFKISRFVVIHMWIS